MAGGPFHGLLGRLGLLDAAGLPNLRAAAGMALVAWSLPAIAALLQAQFQGEESGWAYFRDPTVYARYLVAIFVLVIAERLADERVTMLTLYFRDSGLLDPNGRQRFSTLMAAADRLSSSRLAEVAILLIAVGWSVASTRAVSVISSQHWELAGGEGVAGLSWSGAVSALSGNALFLFLVLRWFVRFGVWTSLLYRASRLPLQIMPLHADGCGGLRFLAIFPGIFTGLVLGLSCVVGAALFKAAPLLSASETALWLVGGFWVALVLLVFLGPLFFFTPTLYLARERAILEYGRLTHGHHAAFRERWSGEGESGRGLLGSADPSSVSDLNASVDAVYTMRVFPIDRQATVQLLVAASVPLLVAAGMLIPLAELLQLIAGVLL